jgi:ribosome-associated protein
MPKVNYLKLAKLAAQIGDDKKAENVQMLNVMKLTPITNYFVFMTALSTPQINAISGEIEQTFKQAHSISPLHRDGGSSSNWRVLDYGGLVVHIMDAPTRDAYALEKLWSKQGSRKKG